MSFSNGVTGTVSAATGTSLTVSLTNLGSVPGGTALTAVATVDAHQQRHTGAQVATVQPAVITFNGIGYASTQLQSAINVAEASGLSGPTITITGSVVGGVTIGAFSGGTTGTLTISGTGQTITAPTTGGSSSSNNALVDVNSGVSAALSGLVLSGASANPNLVYGLYATAGATVSLSSSTITSIGSASQTGAVYGAYVIDQASLSLSSSTVTLVGDSLSSFGGIGVQIGDSTLSGASAVGFGTLTSDTVNNYQAAGIVIIGANGSTPSSASITGSTVTGIGETANRSRGIEVFSGATAAIQTTNVSLNQDNTGSAESDGIEIYDAYTSTATTITNCNVSNNDIDFFATNDTSPTFTVTATGDTFDAGGDLPDSHGVFQGLFGADVRDFGGPSINLINSTLSNGQFGIYAQGCPMTITGTTISNNYTGPNCPYSGGVSQEGSGGSAGFTLTNDFITGNTATFGGGGYQCRVWQLQPDDHQHHHFR